MKWWSKMLPCLNVILTNLQQGCGQRAQRLESGANESHDVTLMVRSKVDRSQKIRCWWIITNPNWQPNFQHFFCVFPPLFLQLSSCPAIILEHRVESWAATIPDLFYFQPLGWQVHSVPRTQWRPPQTAPKFKKRLSFAAVFRVEFCVVPPPRSVYSICPCESQAVQARSRALKIVWRMAHTSALELLWDEFTSPFFISSSGCCLSQINCSENNNKK